MLISEFFLLKHKDKAAILLPDNFIVQKIEIIYKNERNTAAAFIPGKDPFRRPLGPKATFDEPAVYLSVSRRVLV